MVALWDLPRPDHGFWDISRPVHLQKARDMIREARADKKLESLGCQN